MIEDADLRDRVDILIRLTAIQATANIKGLKEKVLILSRAGLSRSEIATIVGTTPMSVSVRLAEAKRSSKKARR